MICSMSWENVFETTCTSRSAAPASTIMPWSLVGSAKEHENTRISSLLHMTGENEISPGPREGTPAAAFSSISWPKIVTAKPARWCSRRSTRISGLPIHHALPSRWRSAQLNLRIEIKGQHQRGSLQGSRDVALGADCGLGTLERLLSPLRALSPSHCPTLKNKLCTLSANQL